MGDTIIIEDEKPKSPDVVVVVPEAVKTEKKTVTERVTVTESKDD